MFINISYLYRQTNLLLLDFSCLIQVNPLINKVV